MNANTIKSFSNAYPSGHPFNLPVSSTTTSSANVAFVLANGNQAIISLPTGTEILGSQTQFSPNANAALPRESGRAAAWFSENRPFFNSGSFNARPFRLRATGVIAGGGTTATSIAATINVYAVQTNVTTVTSGTLIGTINSTAALGNAKAAWYADFPFIWDSASQILQPINTYLLQIGTVTSVAAATSVTGVALSSVSFGITYQFATTSTSNSIGMTELSLEQI